MLLITADHGNADEMLEHDGSPDTAHSLNPVPVVVTVERRGPPRGRHPGRRRADDPRAAGDRAAGRQMTGRSTDGTERRDPPAACPGSRLPAAGCAAAASSARRWPCTASSSCSSPHLRRSCSSRSRTCATTRPVAKRSDLVAAGFGALNRSTIDLETGLRGRLLTGEDRFLLPYRAASEDIPVELRRLRGAGPRARRSAPASRASSATSQSYVHDYADPLLARAGDLTAAEQIAATAEGKARWTSCARASTRFRTRGARRSPTAQAGDADRAPTAP